MLDALDEQLRIVRAEERDEVRRRLERERLQRDEALRRRYCTREIAGRNELVDRAAQSVDGKLGALRPFVQLRDVLEILGVFGMRLQALFEFRDGLADPTRLRERAAQGAAYRLVIGIRPGGRFERVDERVVRLSADRKLRQLASGLVARGGRFRLG